MKLIRRQLHPFSSVDFRYFRSKADIRWFVRHMTFPKPKHKMRTRRLKQEAV